MPPLLRCCNARRVRRDLVRAHAAAAASAATLAAAATASAASTLAAAAASASAAPTSVATYKLWRRGTLGWPAVAAQHRRGHRYLLALRLGEGEGQCSGSGLG